MNWRTNTRYAGLIATLSVFLLLCYPVQKITAQDLSSLEGKQIAFVIGEREYKTKESLTAFAKTHLLAKGIECYFILANLDTPNNFYPIEKLKDADVMVLSVRRRTLPEADFALIKAFMDAGKPVIALRTASHAFHHRKNGPPDGHAEWRTFDVDVLGAQYDGHFGNDLLPSISVIDGSHPVLQGIETMSYESGGSLYRSRNLAPSTNVLLEGRINNNGKTDVEPVAWTNLRGAQRVFYTSLGHTSDFAQPAFQQLLLNALIWSLED